MKLFRRCSALLLAFVMAASVTLCAFADAPVSKATVLFTHDMHSHLLPANDESGRSYGGYARLKTAIDAQKALDPNALLVDGGDFSMGSLFQTSYATTAAELRIMGMLGYEATTFGNHEFDYRAAGLASMLHAALDSGDPLPAIVDTNYLPPVEGDADYGPDAQAVWDAFARYGVTEYTLIEKGDVVYALIGLVGVDSDECAPMSGMILHDRFTMAQQAVDKARNACYEQYGKQPLVIALSHSGTDNGKGEDYELAEKVTGIDLIVSGHSHSVISQPIHVKDTWIVSCGEYSKNLGVVTLDYKPNGEVNLTDYQLIPIDGTLAEDPDISALVESYKLEIDRDYLSRFGMTFDQVITHNPYTFDSVDAVYATAHESTLGNLLSDSYKWAAEQADGLSVDMALTASGVIRESFAVGDLTVSDVFNAASLGIGADGVPGYPLIAIYLNGRDLKNAMEVDASVYPLMHAAQLFCSGVEYSFNTNRMIFNKVDHAVLRRDDGTPEAIVDDQLYRVVTGLYCGQMLGAVESKSFGLLTVTARDAQGNPIDMERIEDYIIHDADGNEVKEWHAVATYLQSMGGELDAKYSAPDGRKVVYSSLNPVKLLRAANKFTFIVLAVILVLILIVALVVFLIVRRVRRRRSSNYRKYKKRRH